MKIDVRSTRNVKTDVLYLSSKKGIFILLLKNDAVSFSAHRHVKTLNHDLTNIQGKNNLGPLFLFFITFSSKVGLTKLCTLIKFLYL